MPWQRYVSYMQTCTTICAWNIQEKFVPLYSQKISRMMVSETSNISPNQALEEKLSNMHEQLAGATSRLDRTERALDLERATREA